MKTGYSSFVQIFDLGKVWWEESIYGNKDVSKCTRVFFAILCLLTLTSASYRATGGVGEEERGSGRETQPGLAKRDVSLLSVFEARKGGQARRPWVSPAASRPQGLLNLRATTSPAEPH